MGRASYAIRIFLAVVLGEISLILLTTIAQEVMFDGIDYYTSPLSDIFFGGLATFFASVLAGLVASLPVHCKSVLPHIILSCLILLETTVLLITGVLSGPLWFDILSGLSLIPGIWVGHFLATNFAYHR